MFFPMVLCASEAHDYILIDAEELKSKIDKNENMVIVDARSNDKGDLIKGAIRVKNTTNSRKPSDEDILKALPQKEQFIVVYCSGPQCTASVSFAKRLKGLGYKNIYKYKGGIKEWKEKFPESVDQTK